MSVLVLIFVALLFLAGLLGSVVPYIPGLALILVGALVYAASTGFTTLGPGRLSILGLIVVLAYSLDYLASVLGVRRLGGSGWGMVGALIGALVGMLAGLPGLLLGPVLGAIAGELVHTRRLDLSLKSGGAAALGLLAGAVAKLCLGFVMIGLFAWWVWRG